MWGVTWRDKIRSEVIFQDTERTTPSIIVTKQGAYCLVTSAVSLKNFIVLT